MSVALESVQTFRVPQAVVDDTWRALRAYGAEGNEGFVLWLGEIGDRIANIARAYVPPQVPIRSEDGVGYFVTSDTLFRLNQTLHASRLRLIAQVHSHPRDAYHSSTDDAFAVVTTEGGMSIVVPNFASDTPSPARCAVYRLRKGLWTELSRNEVEVALDWGHG